MPFSASRILMGGVAELRFLRSAEPLAWGVSAVRSRSSEVDYYTGTVFEARDPAGRFRAILGGGRYDNLVSDVGGEPLPGVGFAMGDVTIGLLMEQAGVGPGAPRPQAQILVCWVDEPARLESLRAAGDLRQGGLSVEWYPSAERLPRQLKYADRQGIPLALIIGSREIERGELTLKDLRDGSQETFIRGELVARVSAMLAKGA
jgi:histidyl-tRNA synthetase